MKILKIFILLFFSSAFLHAKENPDSTKNSNRNFFFYNGLGIGYAEHSAILCDHINFLKGNFVFGASGRISTRRYWRDFNFGPYSTYHEYKFVNEVAFLGGYRILNKQTSDQVIDKGKLGSKKRHSYLF